MMDSDKCCIVYVFVKLFTACGLDKWVDGASLSTTHSSSFTAIGGMPSCANILDMRLIVNPTNLYNV